ncbi:MAG: helix-turn-helix transcriptional regulator [Pseudobacteriovorax sp.]|nr:helix-turn-helix transcriptional regulator [Pseudobacteriovorax sp.]
MPNKTNTYNDKRKSDLQDLTQYISLHLSEPLDLTRLSSHCGLSVFQINRLFKQFVYQTPMQYIWRKRVLYGRRLIQSNPRIPLGDLASSLGFRHHSHFSRLFKSQLGMTPAKYSQKIRRLNTKQVNIVQEHPI